MPNARRPIIPILSICHRDVVAGNRWLKWASFLAQQPGGDVCRESLVVFVTHRVAAMGMEQFTNSILPSKRFFKVYYAVCPDEDETGYPLSANHLFLRALQYCKQHFPDRNALFIEPDCVPVAPDWYNAVQKEYDSHDMAFMGGLTEGGHPHMTGNAVYNKDWVKLAPSMLTVLERRGSGGMFPDGLGFPFDLWIAHEVLQSFHRAETIFQVWSPGRWMQGNLHRIQDGSKLVHQDKTGTLVFTLARTKWPEFMEHMPEPRMFFMLQSPQSKTTINGSTFEFNPCARTSDGAWWSVLRPDTPEDEEILASLAGRYGISSISEQDYKSLLSQKKFNT